MNFLDYIKEKQQYTANISIINEGFKNKSLDKANKLITSLFKKNIDGKVLFSPHPMPVTIKGESYMAYEWLQVKNGKIIMAWTFNYKVNEQSSSVYSIDFYTAEQWNELVMNPKGTKTSLSILTMGSSIAYFLPVVYHVVNHKDFTLNEKTAKALSNKIFNESVNEFDFYIGAANYSVFENLDDSVIAETFRYNVNKEIKAINEAGVDLEVRKYQSDKRDERNDAYHKKVATKDPEDINRWKQLDKEVRAISQAIQGGAKTMTELQFALKKSFPVKMGVADLDKQQTSMMDNISLDTKDPNKGEDMLIDLGEQDDHKTPEQVWKEMRKYIKMVIKGLQPSLIICGAPGVGKTFKVRQQLKAAGYKEDRNMFKFTGRGGAQGLYATLYNYRNKGDIVLIDDCDSLLRDENAINVMKGALDSTSDDEGRKISYFVKGKIFDLDGDEVPKSFYYNGGVIVLTNFNAGQLDTALRGRSFVQDIHFTVEDTLSEIKRLLPEIEPQLWGMKAKTKAYNYLAEVAVHQKNMQLSLRTFGLCAKIYQNAEGDDEFTDEDCESMIKEQMKMQSLSGGKKY